jgi:hypothetical protein
MSTVKEVRATDECRANGKPISEYDRGETLRLQQRLRPTRTIERVPATLDVAEYLAMHMPRSNKPQLPTAVLTIPRFPEDAKLKLGDVYIHNPYGTEQERLTALDRKRREIAASQAKEIPCQTPTIVEQAPTSRPMERFFKSLGKYTGFSLMANTLRKLLRRTSNSSN